MWADALALHQAGRIRATEARASDYYGPGLTDTSHLSMVAPNVLSGKTAFVQGDPDQPHSWTYVDDVARTLAMIGTDSRAWGRAWNVPSPAPMTQRQAIEAMARIAGVKTPRILGSGRWLFEVAGLFSGQWRELGKVHYQWDRPFILDSSAATATFGIEATPMQEGLEATMAWWQARVAA
jgi:nucleoside-diphosphate-sugar epimerase